MTGCEGKRLVFNAFYSPVFVSGAVESHRAGHCLCLSRLSKVSEATFQVTLRVFYINRAK